MIMNTTSSRLRRGGVFASLDLTVTQHQYKHYQNMLIKKGVRQSMSRKGNCLDNAVMENFFGLLKCKLLYLQEFESMELF